MNPNHASIYKDSTIPIKDRVDDLVSQMTLEEKISQMVHDAPAIERLGVPAYNWWNECLHGVGRAGIATVFPQAIGLAATWNVDLIHQVATATSDEARAKHHDALRKGIHRQYFGLTHWSPNVNIFRDPRWGRGQETYGECPYLTARIGVAFVKGLQGNDAKYLKLVATPKHYAVHSGPEPDRHTFNATVDERDLRETYLPHFEACVKEAGAYSIMGAYNRTNGEACCASLTLLEKILREEWGFDGYVVSDCAAIYDIYAHHKIVDTPEEAAALAVKNGCELNCGQVYRALLDAVEQGLISESTIDRALKRLFTARFRLGMFDPPEQVPYAQIPYEVVDSPKHREMALQAARESIVLLKNEDGFLPLQKDIGSIAVIGPNADNDEVLLGNYSGTPAEPVTLLEGIRKAVSPETKVTYAQGCALAQGLPILNVIPQDYLHPTNGGAKQNGLTAAYYPNSQLKDEPALVRIDPLVDFVWKATTPITGQIADPFSVRWTGTLVPPETGTYHLGVKGCSGYKLYLNGKPVVELETWYSPITRATEIELEAGRAYDLLLELVYHNFDHDPVAQLLWSLPGTNPLPKAIEAANNADVVVLALGLSPAVEGEEMPIDVPGFKGGDRIDIGLPGPQKELLKQVYALGKPVVLVLLNGSAVAVSWAANNVPAIVDAWYPGQAGGEAIADVLFGNYNPAGRLPVTFYKSLEDLPPFEDYRMEGRTYRYFRGEPLYSFGYGLSYTTFVYSNPQLSARSIARDKTITISADVQNTGNRAGDEVVQLYISNLTASVPTPIRQLAGFERVHLEPGQTRKIAFILTPRQLSVINDEGQQVVEPGEFQVAIGGHQPSVGPATESDILISTFKIVT
ncbi:MAG: glycoside hydrolase family 3 C-terminal domain-containing protein [Anaerolineae bacterium]|nr:glycoside hydrolase family 3 C-terminal domain-containing protein [Anaerolineae bacterium]